MIFLHNISKHTLRVLVLLATLLLPLQASTDEPLRVGISPTDAPIQFQQSNKLAGVEADFAEALGKELGRKILFIDLKFGKLIPALLSKEVDIIMAGMSVTPLRSMQVSFATPYMTVGQMALVREEDRNTFKTAADIVSTSKTVGTQESTTGQFLLLQEFSNAQKRFFPNSAQGVNALKRKDVDLFILDSPYIQWLAKKNEGKLAAVPVLLTEEKLAWAVRRSDAEFLEKLNSILAKWKTNGQFDEIMNKWVPAK